MSRSRWRTDSLCVLCAASLAGMWLIAATTSADVVVLTTGGRVTGTLVNPDESPRKNYVIQTESGEITLDRSQVKEIIAESPAQREYHQIRFKFADTVEEQWKLAEWCREKGLSPQRNAHLERVIALEPDHKAARAALGFQQVGGRWTRREDAIKERGYVMHKGRMMLPQDVELQEQKAKTEAAQKEWRVKLKRLRAQLDDRGPRAETALAELKTLADAAALPAIVDAFKDERSAKVRALLTDAVARIGGVEAERLLCEIALESGNEETRLLAVDHLKELDRSAAVGYFVRALAGNDLSAINRAGIALGELGDKSAIGPLIEALVSVRKVKVQQGGSGSISPSFDSRGGIGFGVGGKSTVVRQNVQNRGVYDGLVKLAGVNFGYDAVAWRHWLADQRKPAVVPSRRD